MTAQLVEFGVFQDSGESCIGTTCTTCQKPAQIRITIEALDAWIRNPQTDLVSRSQRRFLETGVHEACQPRPRVYMDSQGELWLDAGTDEIVALGEPLLRRIRDKYPTRSRESLEKEFGAFRELT